MGMSTHVVAFRASEEHDKHVRVWRMCRKEGVSLPVETAEYFRLGVNPGSLTPEEVEELLSIPLGDALSDWDGGTENGYEIDISKLPANVRRIRFYNSW